MTNLVDSTALRLLASCPAAYDFRVNQSLVPRAPNAALTFGGCFARGLEALRQRSTLEEAYRIMARYWEGAGLTFDPHESGRHNFYECWSLVLTYLEYWKDSPYELIDGSVETTFALPWPGSLRAPGGDPYVYAGRYDCRASRAGLTFIQDEKTTSSLGPFKLQQWENHGQFWAYLWAEGALRAPPIGLLVRYVVLTKEPRFGEKLILNASHRRAQWIRSVNYLLHELNLYQATGEWPKKGMQSGACSMCDYFKVCQSPRPEAWLPEFRAEPFDPLRRSVG